MFFFSGMPFDSGRFTMNLDVLRSMGFDKELCFEALCIANDKLEGALEVVLELLASNCSLMLCRFCA